jgi:RNase H-fold protein (predicted Holliday junction resolvase)
VTTGGGTLHAVDPGRDKAGFALLDQDGAALAAGVVPIGAVAERVREAIAGHPVEAVAVGRGTNAAALAESLRSLGLPIHLVDEHETSRRARDLYFHEHPPRGWRRFVPRGLQLPPVPVDDYAAILIGRRFLARVRGR